MLDSKSVLETFIEFEEEEKPYYLKFHFYFIFHFQSREFLRSQLYEIIQDPDPEFLYLPSPYWKEAEGLGQ